jgi:hypothetical protein
MSVLEKREKQKADIIAQIREKLVLYKRVFGGKDGQFILDDLRRRSFVNRTTYDPDEKKMAMNEGRRSLFVYIETMVEKDAESVLADLTTGNPEPLKG